MDEELTDTTYGWSQLAEGSLEIEVVTGNHFTMLEEPHVSCWLKASCSLSAAELSQKEAQKA